MKNKLGIVIILLSMAITWIVWLFSEPIREISPMTGYSQLLASFSLVAFAFINFISTRNKILDNLFDGLDKSYIYHKYLSIYALILVILHNVTIDIGKRTERALGIGGVRDPYAMFGSFSMYLFIALIFIALVAKKINYERWKVIHKIIIIPYIFGIYHYYGSATYAVFSFRPYSVWLNIINLTGIVSAVYSIFFYERFSFKYKYKVQKLERVANGTLEITGASLGNDMEFKPGQFAFLKVLHNGSKFLSHPFTISQAHKKGEIQFTIKVLGDDTKVLVDNIKIGTEFSVSGPHGKFDYKSGSKKQIWIAGGIGVTPFRSFAQSNIDENFSIDFFYAYNNEEEAAYMDELEALSKDNLRIHLFNSKEKGFLSVEEISNLVHIKEDVEVYFCGPKPMRENLKKQFKDSKFKVLNFNYEHFQFK